MFLIIFTQAKSSCVSGCNTYSNLIEQTSANMYTLPKPVLTLQMSEASTALDRDPGIYLVDYNLQTQLLNTGKTTNNFTAFIFRVQTATTTHFYFKVRSSSLSHFDLIQGLFV